MSLSRVALAHEADGHPARIHEGSCEAIGRVIDQLTPDSAEGAPREPGADPPQVSRMFWSARAVGRVVTAGLVLMLALPPVVAAAHEQRDIREGQYSLEIGLRHEPA